MHQSVDAVRGSGVARAFAGIGESIEAVQPELGQPVHRVLLLGKDQRNEDRSEIVIPAQSGTQAGEQEALAHAALPDDEVMLRPATRLLRPDIREHPFEERLSGGERGPHVLVGHPARIVERELTDAELVERRVHVM